MMLYFFIFLQSKNRL